MKRREVLIIKSDPLERSPRVVKEFKLLTDKGYNVNVLCWNRQQETCKSKDNTISLIKRNALEFKLKAPFGVKSVPFLFIWWFHVFLTLIRFNQWNVVHVINFPSLFPALLMCKITRKPLIYEILDYAYADQIVMNNVLRRIFIGIEKAFARFSDAIIIVDELQIKEFGSIPNPNIFLIYDSPWDMYNKQKTALAHVKENKDFTLFYAGILYKNRCLNLDKLFQAVECLEGVKVVIAGYGDIVDEIKEWCRMAPSVFEFIGRVSYERVLEESNKADLLFVLRDPVVPVNKYICGSKFLEAIMCSKPILVNKGTSAAKKVIVDKCGIVVDANDIEEIKEAILKLKNNKVCCKNLGENGRKAYENKYGWNKMKSHILNLYSEILKN